MLTKLDFDKGTKSSFVGLIRSELWQSHKDFLEIPLLTVVMLITYSDAGRISRKQHEFYEDAYNALWSKHDARKQPGFEREKYTGLDKQEFTRLASSFCASSYLREDFSMRESVLEHHLNAAKKLTGISANNELFVKDMTISTSLLVTDGNQYRFAHRSFQEFLCAKYVLSLSDDELARGIEAVSGRYATDDVMSFMKSMNAEKFERAWVIPGLSAVAETLERAKTNYDVYIALADGPDGSFLMKLRAIYELSPTNEQVMAAIDSIRHMGKRTAIEFAMLSAGQAKTFLRDTQNFLALYSKLEGRNQKRILALDTLFEGQ